MRSYTGPEATILAARNNAFALRISIKDSGGSYVDYDSLVGLDWQEFCEITQSADQRVAQCIVRLAREADGNSLAPLINADIDAGRDIRVYGSRVAIGSSPSYKLLFQGVVDSWDCAGPPGEPMELVARDDLGELVDRWVEEETEYGATNGRPVESVIQDILSDWSESANLYTPAISGGLVPPYRQQRESVLDATQTHADNRGWVIESRWDDSTTAFRPTFYEPDRTPSATLWTFGPDDYYDVTRLSVSRLNIRNAVTVRYTDSATGARSAYHTEDSASITKYGRLWMELEEGDDSPINSDAEAARMADAALSDLSTPLAEQTITVDLFWPIQLGDPYTFTANDIHYDVDQDLSVTGFTHTFADGAATTTFSVRGAGAVSHTRGWLKRELRPRPREEVIRSVEILRFRVIETTATTVTYGWDLGTDLHAAWVYSFTEPAPISEDFWPSEEVPRTINAHITDRSGTYTVTNPESGNITYLQVEGRRVDGSFGDMERALIFPTSQPGDYIAFASCTVNQSDGSVTIAGWTTERANSIAYAYNKGTAGSTSAPTEAMAEAQGTGASGGGLATGFTSDFEITLPASTLAYGEVIKILLIAYINANGTGPDGTATDHDTPVGCQGERFKITVSDQLATGVVIADKLTNSSKNYGFDGTFSASDWDTVAWTSGTLILAPGTTTYSISSGNTGNMGSDALRYIYFDASVSTTVLQVTTSLSTATTGEGRIFIAVCKRASETAQKAFLVPSVGEFGLNGSQIGSNSIITSHIQTDAIIAGHIQADAIQATHISALAVTAGKIAANAVTAVEIDVVDLASISADIGIITAGTIGASVITASESFTAATAVFDNAMEIQGGEGGPRVVLDASSGGTVTLRDGSGNVAGSVIGTGTRTLSIGGVDALLLGDSEDVYIKAELVSFGANDSGGSGYRVLRVPN